MYKEKLADYPRYIVNQNAGMDALRNTHNLAALKSELWVRRVL